MLKTMIFNKFRTYWNTQPLFKKIAYLYAGIFSISFILFSIFVSLSTSYFFTLFNKIELKNLANNVEKYICSGKEPSSDALDEINNNIAAEINVYEYDSVTSAPKMLFPYRINPFGLAEASLVDLHPIDESSKIFFDFPIIRDREFIYCEKHFSYEGELYKVQILKIIYQENIQLVFILLIFLVCNLIAIFLSFTMGRYVSKRMLTPIKEMTNTVETITAQDFSNRIALPVSNDELYHLAVTFNDMFDRLENSFKNQAQFVSDASHELRTPISVIQGYTNLIDRWGKSDPKILQESIDSIKSETEHMNMLIRKLLFLAKSEQNRTNIPKEMLCLNKIANEVASEVELLDISQPFTYNDKTFSNINIEGDKNLLKQMLWIFIENSQKYSDDNSPITLELYTDTHFTYLSVKDCGIGIPEEDLPFIFERFYRVDKSRNKEISGTGLGLSIAKRIAEQHGAAVFVESKLNEGTTITVAFPLLL